MVLADCCRLMCCSRNRPSLPLVIGLYRPIISTISICMTVYSFFTFTCTSKFPFRALGPRNRKGWGTLHLPIDWLIDYDGVRQTAQNQGHHWPIVQSPGECEWRAVVMLMPAGDNSWLVYQSSLAVLQAETPRPGLNPRPLGPVASTLTTTPPRRLTHLPLSTTEAFINWLNKKHKRKYLFL
jgi:hypothetical protein